MTAIASEICRVLIVDDEAPARSLLNEYLETIEGYEVAAECGNGFEAVKAVAEQNPDLLLLDIQMPKLDGFEVLELLERPIPVVFVTAYDEYALRAFDVHAADYLLKPFSRERLVIALERARERMRTAEPVDPEELVRAARPEPFHAERILVRIGSTVKVIPADDIDYVEASDDSVVIHSRGEAFTKARRLSAIEANLDPGRFVRIHRSFLLNVERLETIELYAKDSRLAILTTGARLPVSRSGYGRLKELL